MAKIKQVAKYDGSSWGTPYDLGADAVNVDVVTGTDSETGENTTDNLQNLIDNIQEDISDIQTDLEDKVDTEDLSGFDFTKTYLETTGNSASTVVNGITNSSDTSTDISSGMQGNSGESTVSLWNKYNKFVKRVGNKFASYLTTSNFNTWANSVIGYNLTSTAPSSTLQAQITSVNNNKVAKAGDIMTGSLSIKSSNISDTMTTAPSSTTYGNGVLLRGSDDYNFGVIQPIINTSNEHGIYISGRRSVDGTNKANYMALKVDTNGNYVVGVSSPSAWRTALNAVNKSGDTITGDLTMDQNKLLIMKDTSITVGTTPSTNIWSGGVRFNDSAGTRIGQVRPCYLSSGRLGMQFLLERGSVQNALTLYIDNDGNPVVSVGDSDATWRTALKAPPISHASSATTYGAGTTSNYGHVKFVDGIMARSSTDPGTANGLAASAHQVWVAAQEAYKSTYYSGWQNFNFTQYNNFELYTGYSAGYYRKGNIVQVYGVIKPKKAITAGSDAIIAKLPTGFTPINNIYQLCQGSTKNTWLLEILDSGVMSFQRYGGTAYADASTGVWLPFHAIFITADAIPT